MSPSLPSFKNSIHSFRNINPGLLTDNGSRPSTPGFPIPSRNSHITPNGENPFISLVNNNKIILSGLRLPSFSNIPYLVCKIPIKTPFYHLNSLAPLHRDDRVRALHTGTGMFLPATILGIVIGRLKEKKDGKKIHSVKECSFGFGKTDLKCDCFSYTGRSNDINNDTVDDCFFPARNMYIFNHLYKVEFDDYVVEQAIKKVRSEFLEINKNSFFDPEKDPVCI
jgi:hypothetical protein